MSTKVWKFYSRSTIGGKLLTTSGTVGPNGGERRKIQQYIANKSQFLPSIINTVQSNSISKFEKHPIKSNTSYVEKSNIHFPTNLEQVHRSSHKIYSTRYFYNSNRVKIDRSQNQFKSNPEKTKSRLIEKNPSVIKNQLNFSQLEQQTAPLPTKSTFTSKKAPFEPFQHPQNSNITQKHTIKSEKSQPISNTSTSSPRQVLNTTYEPYSSLTNFQCKSPRPFLQKNS